jgi:predicted nucleic acid-binding protein
MSSTSAADPASQFVDTSVLVYSFDLSAGPKREISLRLIDRLWTEGAGCLSLQVLQEFYVTATARLRPTMTPAEAASETSAFAQWRLHRPDAGDLLSAIELHQSLRVSFWDAMILQSARRMGCRTLWTEDLADGRTYAGVTVRNPFAEPPPAR